MGWRNDFWGRYPTSKPRKVEGGIKAKSRRGDIGDTWWSKRWVSVLESFGWSNRLERGRRYARSGQVMDFRLAKGRVTARVQGSAPKPYSVGIGMAPLTDEAWDRVLDEMSQKAIFAAKLLAGEMPHNIDEAFDAAGMALFPEASKDIKTSCSCPDSANPCKHIAAVYYILAEEFDRDPFMLFKLRGKAKDEIIALLRKKRAVGTGEPDAPLSSGRDTEQKEVILPLSVFWSGKELGAFSVNISPPDVPGAIIKRLGVPQFWEGSQDDFDRKIGGCYEKVSRRAIEAAYGTRVRPGKRKGRRTTGPV